MAGYVCLTELACIPGACGLSFLSGTPDINYSSRPTLILYCSTGVVRYLAGGFGGGGGGHFHGGGGGGFSGGGGGGDGTNLHGAGGGGGSYVHPNASVGRSVLEAGGNLFGMQGDGLVVLQPPAVTTTPSLPPATDISGELVTIPAGGLALVVNQDCDPRSDLCNRASGLVCDSTVYKCRYATTVSTTTTVTDTIAGSATSAIGSTQPAEPTSLAKLGVNSPCDPRNDRCNGESDLVCNVAVYKCRYRTTTTSVTTTTTTTIITRTFSTSKVDTTTGIEPSLTLSTAEFTASSISTQLVDSTKELPAPGFTGSNPSASTNTASAATQAELLLLVNEECDPRNDWCDQSRGLFCALDTYV